MPKREDAICHYGIGGQKWGTRRYRNYDGSLTPAGKERYGYKEFRDDVRDVKRQAAEIKANTRYRSYKNKLKAIENGQRVVGKFGRVGEFLWYTSGYSFRDRAKFQIAEKRLDAALGDIGNKYNVIYDSKTDTYKVSIRD